MLTPILLRHSVDVGCVEILRGSGLSLSEVPISHVMVPRGRHRSIRWKVSALFLATLRVGSSSLSTFACMGSISLVGIGESKEVKIMLELSHDARHMLPSSLVLDIRWVTHKVAQSSKIDGVLAMEAVASNTPRIPSATGLVLTFDMLLALSTLPARLRVVILKRQHPQPQSNKQSDKPKNGSDNAPALVPHGDADGEEDADDEIEEDGREVKQETELKQLDVRAKPIPEILETEGIVDANMPGTWVVVMPN